MPGNNPLTDAVNHPRKASRAINTNTNFFLSSLFNLEIYASTWMFSFVHNVSIKVSMGLRLHMIEVPF